MGLASMIIETFHYAGVFGTGHPRNRTSSSPAENDLWAWEREQCLIYVLQGSPGHIVA